MVLKPNKRNGRKQEQFENDVKMYGTQTLVFRVDPASPFENDVKMYGTQTVMVAHFHASQFENDVKMYGTQTCWRTQRQ